jgi:hypothetical protein
MFPLSNSHHDATEFISNAASRLEQQTDRLDQAVAGVRV